MFPEDQTDLPCENFVNQSNEIERILRDLAPELLDDPMVNQAINAFLFSAPNRIAPTFSHLRKLIKSKLQVNAQSNLSTILDMLKGAARFRDALQLKSVSDFDQELHIRKEKVLSEIFEPEFTSDLPKKLLNVSKNN